MITIRPDCTPEVLAATGRGMGDWAADTTRPLLTPGRYARLALAPERAALYARCDARFDAMMAAGALEEARAALPLPADLPAMKTVGATELMAHLRGETTLAAAAEKAKTATRNYAKRQLTWLRGQFPDWPVVEDAKTCAETIN